MAWQTELVRMIRYLINDLADAPEFSDQRLEEAILVSAQLVNQETDFANTYTVDVDQCTLSPDPTTLSTKDNAFINLIVLKTACIIDTSKLRTKTVQAGVLVKSGSESIDTRQILSGFQYILEHGACKAYEEALLAYRTGNLTVGSAVLGPYAGYFGSDYRFF